MAALVRLRGPSHEEVWPSPSRVSSTARGIWRWIRRGAPGGGGGGWGGGARRGGRGARARGAGGGVGRGGRRALAGGAVGWVGEGDGPLHAAGDPDPGLVGTLGMWRERAAAARHGGEVGVGRDGVRVVDAVHRQRREGVVVRDG